MKGHKHCNISALYGMPFIARPKTFVNSLVMVVNIMVTMFVRREILVIMTDVIISTAVTTFDRRDRKS